MISLEEVTLTSVEVTPAAALRNLSYSAVQRFPIMSTNTLLWVIEA